MNDKIDIISQSSSHQSAGYDVRDPCWYDMHGVEDTIWALTDPFPTPLDFEFLGRVSYSNLTYMILLLFHHCHSVLIYERQDCATQHAVLQSCLSRAGYGVWASSIPAAAVQQILHFSSLAVYVHLHVHARVSVSRLWVVYSLFDWGFVCFVLAVHWFLTAIKLTHWFIIQTYVICTTPHHSVTLLFGDKNCILSFFNLTLCELITLAIVWNIARSDLFEG